MIRRRYQFYKIDEFFFFSFSCLFQLFPCYRGILAFRITDYVVAYASQLDSKIKRR